MSNHLRNFGIILLLGSVMLLGWKYVQPLLQERLQKGTSDASSTLGTLHVGVDSWIGYFPLCSSVMEKQLRQKGYLLRCEDDKANYGERFDKLEQGKLEFAVATVDSYLLNGATRDYPGTIIYVLDESSGGDAIVARRSVFPDLEAVKQQQKVAVAFTPASPSEHFLKAISSHFGLPFFSRATHKQWQRSTDGSEDGLQLLEQGEVDLAVLWEPDVSRALASSEYVQLLSTEDTDKLIVDILLVERHFSTEQPQAVKALLEAYTETLGHYREKPHQLGRDIKKARGFDDNLIGSMLKGVDWATLNENGADWFAVNQSGGGEGIIEAITFSLKILEEYGDISVNSLPGGDPYRLTNRHFISQLYDQAAGAIAVGDTLSRSFPRLGNSEWSRLKKIGTLKVEPIPFRRATSLLDPGGREVIDTVAERLSRYPNFRIRVEGHTGSRGDPQANLELSTARAKAVASYLIDRYNMDSNRLRAVGYGASHPLPQRAGESGRAYQYRLSRVDISLVTE